MNENQVKASEEKLVENLELIGEFTDYLKEFEIEVSDDILVGFFER